MKNFKGIYTALLTPFDKNDKINEKQLEKLIKYNIENGVTGFYVGGSTGEAFLTSTDERKQVLEMSIVLYCLHAKIYSWKGRFECR